MNKHLAILFVALAALVWATPALAQGRSVDLDRLSEAVRERVRDNMPEWKHSSAEPVRPPGHGPAGRDEVRIHSWASKRGNVSASVVQHNSEQEAAESLRRFMSRRKTAQSVNGLGDEAYQYGVEGRIAFRRKNLNIFISASFNPQADPHGNIPDAAAERATHADEAKFIRAFAHHFAAVTAKF